MTIKEMAESLHMLAIQREKIPEEEYRIELNEAIVNLAERIIECLKSEFDGN